MKTNVFSNETLNATVTAIGSMQNEIDNMRKMAETEPVDEAAQRFLMDNLAITQGEAEEICNDISQGIEEFDEQMKASRDNGKVNLRDKLLSVIADMDYKKRDEYLSGVLTALQMSENPGMTTEQVAEAQAANADRTIEELIDDIVTLFDRKFPIENIANFVDTNLNANAVVELANQIGMYKEENRFITAVALYAAQEEGKVELSESGDVITARMFGALASAGVETILATGDLKEGKIDLKKWQTILKFILGALIGCALTCLAILAITCSTLFLIAGTLSLFGDSVLAFVATGLIGVPMCFYATEYLQKGISALLDFLGSLYDQYIEPITIKTKQLAATVKNWAETIVNMIKSKAESKSKSTEKQDKKEDEVEEENTENTPNVVLA